MPRLVIGVAVQAAHAHLQAVAPPHHHAVIPNVAVPHHIVAATGRQTKKIAVQLILLRTNACE